MKRLTATLIAVICSFSIATHTYAFNWKSLNVDTVNQEEDGSKTILILSDQENRVFKVITEEEIITSKLAEKIIKFKNDFYSWRNIRLQELSFMVFANLLDVVIIPRQIIYNDQNLATAIPAGITMSYNPALDLMHYDFRLMKENLFLRIDGDYLNEERLMAEIASAYENPAAYLQRTAPVAAEPQRGNHNGEDEKTRQALIYLYNEDWNGRHRAVPPEVIQRVAALKQSHPGLTHDQLWKLVKQEKIKLTKKEFDLILAVYFNEFK